MPAGIGGGGLVEINDAGKAVRSAGNIDPAFPNALMMPYSLAVLPEIDRVLSTNSSMHGEDIAGTTVIVALVRPQIARDRLS